MKESQRFENHRRLSRLHHFIWSPLALVTLGFAASAVIEAWRDDTGKTVAIAIFLLAFMALLASVASRRSAMLVQDRAIRTEESLRHFILAGKRLDSRLTLGQIIALRFASDEEFVQLAALAAETGMKPTAIKQAVKTWRPDVRRV